jgi:GT2 family glycosyltransferase
LLTQYPAAGYAHGAVHQIDALGKTTRVRRLSRLKEYVDSEESLADHASGYRVSANIIMFRRRALEQVNFWRADMAFADDWDLAVRLADAGWGNVYCADIIANYRVWSDGRGYRQGRKVAELDGIRRVFADSLCPAYERRGWDLRPLLQRRRRIAVAQANALAGMAEGTAENAKIRSALHEMGDSKALHASFWLIDHRLGFILLIVARGRLWITDCCKRILSVLE